MTPKLDRFSFYISTECCRSQRTRPSWTWYIAWPTKRVLSDNWGIPGDFFPLLHACDNFNDRNSHINYSSLENIQCCLPPNRLIFHFRMAFIRGRRNQRLSRNLRTAAFSGLLTTTIHRTRVSFLAYRLARLQVSYKGRGTPHNPKKVIMNKIVNIETNKEIARVEKQFVSFC